MKRPAFFLLAAALSMVLTRGVGYELDKIDVSKIPPASKEKVDFARDVYPIFKEHCISCHGPDKQKGKYRTDTKDGAFKAGENGFNILPGHSEKSPMILMISGLIDEMLMPPPKAEPMTKEEIGILRAWVDQGAVWPDGPIAEFIKKVEFVRDIQPIFEKSCIECHGAAKQLGEFRLDQKEAALKGGKTYGQVIKAGDPAKSTLIIIISGKDEDLPQPEKHKLADKQVELVKRWIEQGAVWP